ncbi:conserved hypothetical protein [Rippkaea orientalis PCC 8801]|uniref:Uncharacterized protein n=1 Tax=Rippkaea orientalis (strain PCC 8801 / RF-1) TaxID=41431 RepID=B7K5Y1_RIPO1|nr:hypothetical protein [Rippkaea orientalis]ACK68034.1 conserved hypothetical protein [Rippkaea orientalis PCC 8801]
MVGIGDPSLIGWLTVLAYLLTAILCLLCSTKDRANRIIWRIFALILLGLGINKQLDLQSWFTLFGKQVAITQGWYHERRIIQKQFIVGLIALSFSSLMFLFPLITSQWKRLTLAWVGIIFLITFIIIRAASFHKVDHLLGFSMMGLRLNWLLELSGISSVAVSACKSLKIKL